MLLSVLRSKAKNGENDLPTRLDELDFLVAQCGHAHHNILLYLLLLGMQVVVHDGLEWLQEHLLVAEVLALLLLQELIGQLSQ